MKQKTYADYLRRINKPKDEESKEPISEVEKFYQSELKKYENNNTRSTRNGKDNNIVKLSRRIYTKWDKA